VGYRGEIWIRKDGKQYFRQDNSDIYDYFVDYEDNPVNNDDEKKKTRAYSIKRVDYRTSKDEFVRVANKYVGIDNNFKMEDLIFPLSGKKKRLGYCL